MAVSFLHCEHHSRAFLRTFSETWVNVSVAGGIEWGDVRSGTYVHDGDGLLARRTEVLDHVLDEHGALGDLTLCDEESVQCEVQKWPGVEDIPVTISPPRWIHALTVYHSTLDIGLTLLVGGDALAVGNDFHAELVVLDDTLDGSQVHPDVVGVEVLELLDGLELVDVLLGDLSDLEEAGLGLALVVDDGATLDISLGLVGQLHDVLGAGLNHVDDGAEEEGGC
jgi:hypothetical protein